jgi:hypothetical protein
VSATADVTVERTAFLWRVAMYGIFGALLVVTNAIVDYARIRAVVEDRRSMVMALAAAARFVGRNPGRVFGLYGMNAAAFLAVIGIWALVAPGARGGGAAMWFGFVVAQLYVLARLFVKMQFIASQTALFQASLAHAGYTSAPLPVWPESPSAEVIHERG